MAKDTNQQQQGQPPQKSKRDMFRERVKTRHPDLDIDDEEAYYDTVGADIDDYENQLTQYRDNESKLTDMFASDPRSAQFLVSWRNGEDPAIALIRLFGTEIRDVLDDPERIDEIAKANKEYVERVAKSKELDDEYAKNIKDSLERLDKMSAEEGVAESDLDDAVAVIIQMTSNGLRGIFTPEMIQTALKAVKHDADVEGAASEAEVRGKNAGIEAKLRKRAKGDGQPALGGKNQGKTTTDNQPTLDALDNITGRRSIWDSAEEKRIRHTQ